ncbi:MAG: alanine racemase [Thermodesulfobacteriota bacterium]
MSGEYEYRIRDLVQRYGSPLFVASADIIRNNLETFRGKFTEKYPKAKIAYSYKVNYLPGILEVIHRDGTWAEVASGFEYELARKLGVPGGSIVFNGPYKKKKELELALDEGAIINVDSYEELKTLERIAAVREHPINIGIRINTDVGIDQLPDRFGFNLESGEAADVVRECAKSKLISITGLHIHLTSYIIRPGGEENTPAKNIELIWPKGPEAYRRAAANLVRLADDLRNRYGVYIRYIDVGGGFPVVDSLPPYVEAITQPIVSEFKQSELPVLILEPGRAIVSNAVDLITTVVTVKNIPDGKRAVVIDGGINLLPTSFWRYQDIECAAEPKSQLKETIVYGPLCLQTDIVCKKFLPELIPGDIITIKNIGAYNIPQSSTFIFPLPPVLLIENGKERIIRRAETVEDSVLL